MHGVCSSRFKGMGALQKVHLLFDEQLTEKEKVASPNCTFLDQFLNLVEGFL